ncbi:iron-containing alcohol dehydrogenase [Ruminiclostridium papyrosolvens DSM 2782]|uniref:Aldehyde-alcohol dehydrogenase n=1 Tax=Ruminiclostridium papyrosolvens DSM 2782 TaxID=588581 RepID=F1TBE9_9FIRM|nr:bifunctional acetaldehyde-CoA/alcohol dehydrogenase [Ruminiclostridium papyrosolvens]EGD48353.1 iron-containing alcohol dehydrogenase [Ruminiclostridium papyrosolvens DSM 2782]WES34143.1 bifunctional acetaldehyde-CoA/alcohol dehydrogenase [Ruminiclostridium papyrosolvens DSM 2782]
MTKKNLVVNSVDTLLDKLAEIRKAQQEYSTFTQEQVDKIFLAASLAANKKRIPLAKMAQAETGMGVIEDKVIKNHYAAEYIYNAYKDTQTCGVIERDEAFGITKIAEPLGVVAAIVPTTNPTSTAIFKALIALKTRNGIIFSPHPRAKKSTIEAANIILEAAVAAGAPKGIIGWVDEPTIELSERVMKEADIILATGGPGMVKAAYSSGKPAIGVGPGNVPAIIDESADIKTAVSSIIVSKTFDNGMICASEQSVIVLDKIYNEVKKEFSLRGAYMLNKEETQKVREVILINGALNAKIVGQSAHNIAKLAGFEVPVEAKILVGEVESVELSEAFAHEKLSPVLAMYKAKSFDDAVLKAERLIADGGFGHTASLYIDTVNSKDKLDKFTAAMKTCRIVINTPSAQGGIGDLYNFKLAPSLTLGCGSWGGNSVSENVGVKHLINIKTVAERRENMLWFRAPEKVYFKKGCLGVALKELKTVMNKQRAFIVTDSFLYNNGYTKAVTNLLDDMNIKHHTFFDVAPDPTLACAKVGAEAMRDFKPDVIIALGGGSAMDAGKIMWTMYEHPEVDFQDLAMRFMDIRKRVYTFPKMGEKAYFVAIPTSAGTGSEVTPFAVITDEQTGVKYPLADYELMPKMAIVDADLMMNMPKGLTSASGIDALTHALEAYASMLSTDYTKGLALQATKSIFEYLPSAYENGAKDPIAREKMADASTMAGMAFANAFLGVCHSMAHKLGAFHHLPHGVANALLITEVMKFNIAEAPVKMGAFSQYKYPEILKRYAEIASFIGITGSSDEDKFKKLIVKIDELKAKVGLPKTIKEAGVDEKKFLATLDEMVEQAFDDQCTGANPRYPLLSEIKDMYLKVYYGK